MRCSQCGGSGKTLSKRSMARVECPCCHGSGKAPEHVVLAEMAAVEHHKHRGAVSIAAQGRLNRTGSYPVYRPQ